MAPYLLGVTVRITTEHQVFLQVSETAKKPVLIYDRPVSSVRYELFNSISNEATQIIHPQDSPGSWHKASVLTQGVNARGREDCHVYPFNLKLYYSDPFFSLVVQLLIRNPLLLFWLTPIIWGRPPPQRYSISFFHFVLPSCVLLLLPRTFNIIPFDRSGFLSSSLSLSWYWCM